MKSIRNLFLAALTLLFGPWVNMQAQEIVSVDGNTIGRVYSQKSSKALKQKRAEEFIIDSSEPVQLGSGVSVSFELSADCTKKGFMVQASKIAVKVQDASEPIPLQNLDNYLADKESIVAGLEAKFKDLKSERPGESSDKREMRIVELEKLEKEIVFHRDLFHAASMARPAVIEVLDRFSRHIISGE